MSLEYVLYSASTLHPSQAMSLLAQTNGFAIGSESQLTAAGVDAQVGQPYLARPEPHPIEKEFGFAPKLRVVFCLRKDSALYANGICSMMRLTMKLLEHSADDAVLLFNGEIPELQRNGQKLFVKRHDESSDHQQLLLQEVTLPYQLSDFSGKKLQITNQSGSYLHPQVFAALVGSVAKVHATSEFAGAAPEDDVAEALANLTNGRAKPVHEAGPLPGEGVYTGRATNIPIDEAPENRLALQRENEAAQTLKDFYKLEQNPASLPNGKNPDYKIGGHYWDCYSPTSSSARNIWSNIKTQKIDAGQTNRIVLNLEDSAVSLGDLKAQFGQYEMPGLEDMIVLKNGQAIPFWDFLH